MADFDPTVDIRPTIAHGRGYNPTAHQHEPTPFKEFPKFLHVGGKSVIVNNPMEESQLLGIEEVKAKKVSVDITTLSQSEPVPVAKRKYTKKAPLVLPPDLG